MERIPIHDATAPIVCTITDAEVAERIQQFDRLRAGLTGIDRTAHGMALHFAADPVLEADVRRFTVDENRCCTFWGFAVEQHDDGLTLQWDAPPDAAVLVDQLHAYFTGDHPFPLL